MLILRTCAVLALAAVAGGATVVPAAIAQANCEAYGKFALQQQQENERNKCGFTGPEWSSDLRAHLAWCGSVAPLNSQQQLQKRKQMLDDCKAKN
jgi:hypothetical protein